MSPDSRRLSVALALVMASVLIAVPALAAVVLLSRMRVDVGALGRGLIVLDLTTGDEQHFNGPSLWSNGTFTDTAEADGVLRLDHRAERPIDETTEWWHTAWTTRQCFTVTTPAAGSMAVPTTVSLTIDTTQAMANGEIGTDDHGIRAVADDGAMLPFSIRTPIPGPDTAGDTEVWVGLPASPEPTQDVCLYWGNADTATSDWETALAPPRHGLRYYTLGDGYDGGTLAIVSYDNDNTITVDGATQLAQRGQVLTFNQVTKDTVVTTTGPVTGSGGSGTDALVPEHFAGTSFVFADLPDPALVWVRSPFGSAEVLIQRAGATTAVSLGPADGSVGVPVPAGTGPITVRTTNGTAVLTLGTGGDGRTVIGVPTSGGPLYGPMDFAPSDPNPNDPDETDPDLQPDHTEPGDPDTDGLTESDAPSTPDPPAVTPEPGPSPTTTPSTTSTTIPPESDASTGTLSGGALAGDDASADDAPGNGIPEEGIIETGPSPTGPGPTGSAAAEPVALDPTTDDAEPEAPAHGAPTAEDPPPTAPTPGTTSLAPASDEPSHEPVGGQSETEPPPAGLEQPADTTWPGSVAPLPASRLDTVYRLARAADQVRVVCPIPTLTITAELPSGAVTTTTCVDTGTGIGVAALYPDGGLPAGTIITAGAPFFAYATDGTDATTLLGPGAGGTPQPDLITVANPSQGLYVTHGTWVSAVIDTGATGYYGILELFGSLPDGTGLADGTGIAVQIASGATREEAVEAPFLGPDGSAATAFGLGPSIMAAVHDGHGFLRIRVALTGTDGLTSPQLDAVTVGTNVTEFAGNGPARVHIPVATPDGRPLVRVSSATTDAFTVSLSLVGATGMPHARSLTIGGLHPATITTPGPADPITPHITATDGAITSARGDDQPHPSGTAFGVSVAADIDPAGTVTVTARVTMVATAGYVLERDLTFALTGPPTAAP